ncbi:hypothetical protein L0F63_000877, partial [Massospora cicadina]
MRVPVVTGQDFRSDGRLRSILGIYGDIKLAVETGSNVLLDVYDFIPESPALVLICGQFELPPPVTRDLRPDEGGCDGMRVCFYWEWEAQAWTRLELWDPRVDPLHLPTEFPMGFQGSPNAPPDLETLVTFVPLHDAIHPIDICTSPPIRPPVSFGGWLKMR